MLSRLPRLGGMASCLMSPGLPRCCVLYSTGETAASAAHQAIGAAQAVCFDVDSTVIQEEGIDVLAAHCGAGEAVAEWTSKAMNGNVKFEDALAARLDLIKPSRDDISSCLAAHPPRLTPGVSDLVAALHARGSTVYLVSGGFRLMIEPVAEQLGIPKERIFANTILFNDDGSYSGFDASEPTSADGGKPAVIQSLKDARGYSPIVMIGDGATDMQAKPPADAFIGFGGVVVRDTVRAGADLFISEFAEITTTVREGNVVKE